jgi:hypothetical protein
MKSKYFALSLSVAVGSILVFCMITLLTWPPFVDGAWKLSHPPAWWQFESICFIGFILCALPSYVTYRLDSFLRLYQALRYPIVFILVAAEILFICSVVYRLAVWRWRDKLATKRL